MAFNPSIMVRVRVRKFWTFGAKTFGCIAAVSLLAAHFCIDRGISCVVESGK